MGYVASTRAIMKAKPFLDAMVKSEVSLVWMVDDPRRVAYQIREALYSAEKLDFDHYKPLKNKFLLHVREDKVVAELRHAPVPDGKLAFSEDIDPLDIVQTIIRHKTVDFKLLFPNASKQEHNVKLIHDWCKDNGYEYEFTPVGLEITKAEEPKRLNLGDLDNGNP